ncbi:hypothetical protein [Marivirga arenosa]|uniref:DUF2281 domain-containing protein n=1 Tax=Marivirga arenosa TaxID=3059076 RepID=A0AA49GH09_9BACT|nr:hypothetical protein [Marivirga sp. BKB1-2]WKK82956.1 hypothetical protein QYS47_13710 [Marivirga sp. BKB1-2]
MSREEVKIAINEMLENIPEEALQEVFEFLTAVKNQSSDNFNTVKNLRTILSEDKQLLEKLAK